MWRRRFWRMVPWLAGVTLAGAALAFPACNSPDAVRAKAAAGSGGGAGSDGAPCTGAEDCVSGHCVDGVCCEGPCEEACETCAGAEPGTCAQVEPGRLDAECDGVCWDDGACRGDGEVLCDARVTGPYHDLFNDVAIADTGAITIVGYAGIDATFHTPTDDGLVDIDGHDGFRLALDDHCGLVSVYPVGGALDQALTRLLPALGGHLLAGWNHGVLDVTSTQFVSDVFHTDAFLVYMSPTGNLADTATCTPLFADASDCAQYYGEDAGGPSDHAIAGLVGDSETWYLAVNVNGYFKGDTVLSESWDARVVQHPDGSLLTEAVGPGEQEIGGLARLSNGDLLVGGDTDTTFTIENTEIDLTNGGTRDSFVAHGGPSGVNWHVTEIGNLADEHITGVAPTDDGGYIVIGRFLGSALALGELPPLLDSGGISNGFIARFAAADTPTWSAAIESIGTDPAGVSLHQVVVDSQGFIVVAGETAGTGVSYAFPDHPELSWDTPEAYQAFVMKIAPNGEHVWTSLIQGPSQEYVGGLAVHPVTGVIALVGHGTALVEIGGSQFPAGGLEDGYMVLLAP